MSLQLVISFAFVLFFYCLLVGIPLGLVIYWWQFRKLKLKILAEKTEEIKDKIEEFHSNEPKEIN